ncbi:MAG: Omp28-related outer membrane protein [Candidatus Methylacidiphilales bacterium]
MVALTAGSLFLASCSKEETKTSTPTNTPIINFTQSNRALIIDITGTWCPPCGAYGIPGFNYAVDNAKDKTLPLALHSGDPLSLPAVDTIMVLPKFKSNSVPRIAAGNGLVFPAGVYSDFKATGQKIISSVDTFIQNNQFIVGVSLTNLKVDSVNGTIKVDVNAKFFKEVSGEYYIATYFYEDGVISNQKMAGAPDNPNQVHNHVVRAAPRGAWGEVLSTGSSNINKVFTQSYTYILDSKWNSSKLAAMTIVWKKDGKDFSYVNGNLIEQ